MTELPYRSIPDMFLKRVATSADTRAFAHPAPGDAGEPVWLTWSQVGARAKAIAAGLHDLGVRREDRVAILAGTRVEWVLADLGVMCAGAATTTVYPTTEAEDAAFIVGDSGSKVLIAEDAGQAAKVKTANLPHLAAIVVMDGEPGESPVPAFSLADLERRGNELLARQPSLIEEIVAGIGPDHLATLIYTSGTTGRPKGVELLHAGWVWQGKSQSDLGLLRPDDMQYLWLPLSHSFGKTLLTGVIYVGMPTYVDGRVDKIIDNLGAIRPTIMAAAPRVFEKVYNAVVTTAKAGGGAKWKIFTWALAVGKQVAALKQAGKPVPAGLSIKYAIADKLVFVKLRERMGGRMRGMVSGSAPLAKEIAEFFYAAGMPILEGYGLTETFAGSFVNRPDHVRVGTVGQVLGGDLEVKLDTDGEILIRGVPVMRGYHNLPEETAAAFTPDGFFRTGDIGELDADGYLRITDRKKDLIKTSGGKYVAPSHIEGRFKSICPYTSQTLVIGQARNYCTMLVTLDPDAIAGWVAGTPLEGRPYSEIASSQQVRELIEGYVKQLNERLNRWETIKRFVVLARDLTIEDGELTPSMKVKRRVVEQKFADDIEKMYVGSLAQL